MTYQAVIFDLDDTLLDTFDARVHALHQAFNNAGVTRLTAAEFLSNLRGIELQQALSNHEMTSEIATELYDDYRKSYWTKKPGLINLYPSIEAMLRKLCNHGLKLGVVTQKRRQFEINGYLAGAMTELEEAGISDFFSAIVGFEDVTRTKPDPQGVQIALARLVVSPNMALVVGDSDADMGAARAAGCHGCHATWGIGPGYQLKDSQPHFVADSPEALCQLIFRAG
ncbi:MAG: HAD family hydrolase [Chloroflexi bacterium]|nr:HAD family hydrolase [Chloroflexota bacterium]